jgi:hypothetical protein
MRGRDPLVCVIIRVNIQDQLSETLIRGVCALKGLAVPFIIGRNRSIAAISFFTATNFLVSDIRDDAKMMPAAGHSKALFFQKPSLEFASGVGPVSTNITGGGRMRL